MATTIQVEKQVSRIQQYYRFQSKIYDLTRWSFLFGRRAIVKLLPYQPQDVFTLLEVGCGTGHNLKLASRRFPNAHLIGLDVSGDMLSLAGKQLADKPNISLLEQPYGQGTYPWSGKVDVILFSYSLSMINPQWESLLAQALVDLRPGGMVAIADFHDSRMPWFKRHMSGHHVRMDGHLKAALSQLFNTRYVSVRKAYSGIWTYFLYLGQKPDATQHAQ